MKIFLWLGLIFPKQNSKPPIEMWNTINQQRLGKFSECQAPHCTNVKHPLLKIFRQRFWIYIYIFYHLWTNMHSWPLCCSTIWWKWMLTLMRITTVTFLQPHLRFKLFLRSQFLYDENRSYDQNDEWRHPKRPWRKCEVGRVRFQPAVYCTQVRIVKIENWCSSSKNASRKIKGTSANSTAARTDALSACKKRSSLMDITHGVRNEDFNCALMNVLMTYFNLDWSCIVFSFKMNATVYLISNWISLSST